MGLLAADGKIAFVHIPKCGGWSVKTWLCQAFGLDDSNPQALVKAQGFPIGHVRLADFPHYLKRDLDSFECIIAIVRDPYARELSQWKFWWERRAKGNGHVHDIVAGQYNNLTDFLQDPRGQFHVWYKQHHEHPPPEQRIQYRDVGGFYRYFLDPFPDNLEIVRLEDLARDLPPLVQPFVDGDLPELPHMNASSHPGETAKWYTPEGVRIVNERYEWAWKANWYQQWRLG